MFRPSEAMHISIYEIKQILEGKVLGPDCTSKKKSLYDYSYFLVCNLGIDSLQEVKERDTSEFICGKGFIDSFYSTQWFGKLSIQRSSQVIFPETKQILDFQIKESLFPSMRLSICSDIQNNVWAGGGYMQTDKDLHQRLITTDVSAVEFKTLIREYYMGDMSIHLLK